MISLLKFNTQLPLQTSWIWKRRGRHFQPLFLLSKFFFSVLTTLPYNCNNQNRNLESSWFTTIKWRVLITSIHLSCLVKLSKNNFIYEKKILRMSNINKNCWKSCKLLQQIRMFDTFNYLKRIWVLFIGCDIVASCYVLFLFSVML